MRVHFWTVFALASLFALVGCGFFENIENSDVPGQVSEAVSELPSDLASGNWSGLALKWGGIALAAVLAGLGVKRAVAARAKKV
jgi:hypothetical protein